MADYDAVQAFWDRGRGRLAFDVDDQTYGFGSSLADGDVAHVLCAIATRLPTSEALPADNEPDVVDSLRRRLGWMGYVTRTLLGAGLLIPAASLITDLPICTGGALGGEYEAMSVARLRGEGQVILVPFSDFPEASARQIAEHFQGKYNLAISAGPALPLPNDAIDRDRGQLDSNVLMSQLERAHPDPSSVVIGLTAADMFIRDVDWRYAFSNRRAPRLAVVSPFRMDRGCFGIPLANDDTRMARLRKMVGKNIGVLFYKLPLSNHPRSMMYADIGGPQELDTIREEF
jgi:predicted Zn-dependent protease